jgi:hypothetical protein
LVEVDHGKDGRAVNALDHALFHRRAAAGFDQLVTDPALLGTVA